MRDSLAFFSATGTTRALAQAPASAASWLETTWKGTNQ